MSDSEEPLDMIDEGGEDLFGEEDAEPESPPRAPALDDDDDEDRLDSDGDNEPDQRHRQDASATPPQLTRDKVVIEQPTYRHRIPKPSDGILRVLRVPKFIRFMPEVYAPESFEPSEFDVANAKAEHPKLVARVKRDAKTEKLVSNTNICRWNDGSVTISVGGEHYEIEHKMLASAPNKPYNELQDAHYYVAAAELGSNMLMTVGHLMEQFNVRPNKAVGDDALSIFAERMAQASKAKHGEEMIVKTTTDPELQKKQAELAEKERIKAQRRRENAAAKMDGNIGRARGGGLSIGDLEGERRYGRKRGAMGSTKPKRRRPEYDSDDDLPQGVGRHERYDLDDGFLVASDEEEEAESGADEDEEDEGEEEKLRDDGGGERHRSKKRRTAESEEHEEDAEGDEVEAEMETSSRARRRNVLEDEDEE
ncbi:hypothetical protein CDD81_4346 [Ophiocordyceps australis]|uniref:Leo1-like protein n=1 Tax=Ophiocordyceps australis TaxID=1399860 RepID=A0A2C5Y787_9HYPO|nr:hypothetical protein CDD81_4346 [Ophiocordyceps australis]